MTAPILRLARIASSDTHMHALLAGAAEAEAETLAALARAGRPL